MASLEFVIIGLISIGGGIVHWFRPFLTHKSPSAGIWVNVERVSRFEIIVGRVTAVLIVLFGAFMLWIGFA